MSESLSPHVQWEWGVCVCVRKEKVKMKKLANNSFGKLTGFEETWCFFLLFLALCKLTPSSSRSFSLLRYNEFIYDPYWLQSGMFYASVHNPHADAIHTQNHASDLVEEPYQPVCMYINLIALLVQYISFRDTHKPPIIIIIFVLSILVRI